MLGRYKRNSVETAGKLDLVIMCYDKTIQFLRQAKTHLDGKEIEKKARKIQKALDIINELQRCLNFAEGGEIAKNLDAIYNYLQRRLIDGDIRNNPTVLEECVRILDELKDAWEKIDSVNEIQADPVPTSAATRTDRAQIAA